MVINPLIIFLKFGALVINSVFTKILLVLQFVFSGCGGR